jgi:crossover junction endodeoxyribonuclease RuvC
MRILGIDPGSRLTGFGLVHVLSNGKINYVASGVVKVPAVELAERLRVIYESVTEVIGRYRPEVVAVEKVFMARNADSALKLGQARAAAILAAANSVLPVSEYTALQVKQALVGKGHAHKDQVKHMVRHLLVLSGTPQTDAADALACAICHAHHAQSARRTGVAGARYRARRSLRSLRIAS